MNETPILDAMRLTELVAQGEDSSILEETLKLSTPSARRVTRINAVD